MTTQANWSALASGARRMILMELAKGEKTVTELVEALKSSQPNVSQHIGILREAGLISGRSVPRPEVGGAWRVYHLEPEGLIKVRAQYNSLLDILQVAAETQAQEAGSVASSTQ